MRFYGVQDPLGLTMEAWDELMDARATIIALEEGDGQQASAALAERRAKMVRLTGWN